MSCGLNEVSVTGVEIEVIETGNGSKRIRHALGHSGAEELGNFLEMGEAAFAFEALEEGGNIQRNVVFFREILEEIAAALKEMETTADTEFGPEMILQDGAVSAVF